MTDIFVITEGATEREVGRILHQRGILSQQGVPKPPHWKNPIGRREGFDQIIAKLTEERLLETLQQGTSPNRLLLIFDQEDTSTAIDKAKMISTRLGLHFIQYKSHANLFEHHSGNLRILLHISSPTTSNIARKDFDGYILQILQSLGDDQKLALGQRLLGNQAATLNINEIFRKAEHEIPALMERNHYPWTHAKSWIYAYITAFQFRQSHVAFACAVVEASPENTIKTVFDPLIAAWEGLLS